MLVLGLETSGDVAGVALTDAEGTRREVRFRHELQLSRDLLPTVQQTVRDAGCTLQELQGIAVSTGPGSFTGLRIGVTAAKSLAYALAIPAAPVSTLAALAWETPPLTGALICAVISGSKKDLFAGLYRWTEGCPQLLSPEALMEPGALGDLIDGHGEPVLFAGLLGPHRETLQQLLGDRGVFQNEERLPAPSTIARLGRVQIQLGETLDPHDLAPHYLRLSTPEQRRLEAVCLGS